MKSNVENMKKHLNEEEINDTVDEDKQILDLAVSKHDALEHGIINIDGMYEITKDENENNNKDMVYEYFENIHTFYK